MKKITPLIILLLISFFFSKTLLAQVSPDILSQATLVRFEMVPEFKFIQEEANKLEIKVYLFGGTASAFAHYVRWDLEREAGDEKYQPERFDYDFTNIYRGNQDLDIVVDGTAEQAEALKHILAAKFPHFIGAKEAWEVRLLSAQVGDKLPLLDNYDFLNQHTDTNSTGLLALNPSPGEIVFRDLFSWHDPKSQFLNDVANGEIKFLLNANHGNTSRFKEGKNPPIFAALRYLAKLTQYEVVGTPEDLNIIRSIIENTNWIEIKTNRYVKHKLDEFARKVLLNAPNIEYAWGLLESLKLREKLINMDEQKLNSADSLSWWLNKEPLRSFELGSGAGKTAQEIFSSRGLPSLIVAHETRSFIAYESITRSAHGDANVFISRKNTTGEGAAYGDGFYTRIGATGAVGSGLTIRFHLHPNAREGKDFIMASSDYVVVLNKKALTLIPDNINLDLLSYFQLLLSGEISSNDKGFIEKIKRKLQRNTPTDEDIKNTLDLLKQTPLSDENSFAFVEWFKNPVSILDSDFFISFAESSDLSQREVSVLEVLFRSDHWRDHYFYIETYLKEKNHLNLIYNFILEDEIYKAHHDRWIRLIIRHADYGLKKEIAQSLSKEKVNAFMPYASVYIKSLKGSGEFAEESLSNELLKQLSHYTGEEDQSEFIDLVFANDNYNVQRSIIIYLLSKKNWSKEVWVQKMLDSIIKKKSSQLSQYFLESVLSKPWLSHRTDWFLQLLEISPHPRGHHFYFPFFRDVLLYSAEHWQHSPELIEKAYLKARVTDSQIFKNDLFRLLKSEHWQKNVELKAYMQGQELNSTNFLKRLEEVSLEKWLKEHRKEKTGAFTCQRILQ